MQWIHVCPLKLCRSLYLPIVSSLFANFRPEMLVSCTSPKPPLGTNPVLAAELERGTPRTLSLIKFGIQQCFCCESVL
jgi:hypothetical protein